MSSPAEFYNSLPPISKFYGTACLLATTAFHLGLYDVNHIALIYKYVFKYFQVWRLITNFFFLGKFSINFGIRLLMIARYGVQLEKGPFERRTADFLWMMIFGAFSLLAFYLPWAMLALDVIFGAPLVPDLLGIIAGHLYYFLTVLHPLATGKCKPNEISDIMKDFDEPGHLAPTGLHLGGTKYMVIQGEPGAVIRGKKGSGGITVKKTGQALVFGIYEEPVTPGQCNMVVERLGDYLADQGL